MIGFIKPLQATTFLAIGIALGSFYYELEQRIEDRVTMNILASLPMQALSHIEVHDYGEFEHDI